ncbi:LTA synthase family protein [Aureibacter tunicatorum]|uniref:Phosphoglycerol transferase MdoB-like AlkP superfamily enzyme n=1 Tax=Aureibacter tunicatorum TaxID=866807 RepID=A0AAE3XQS7_9BACT|nr:sulfatase-like hydrolase/transferase [Aureibacter tunicatorum]MDR6240892.1 phosphoglycerol transferase MdoB-like AlkP superfamily enzyme [Aureibacter tunicatorum]
MLLTFNQSTSDGLQDIYKAFANGAYLDMSMAGYFITIPVLLGYIFTIHQSRFLIKVNSITNSILLFTTFTLAIVDIPLYYEWQSKINYKIFNYLSQPWEVLKNTPLPRVAISFILIACFTYLFKKIYQKIVFDGTYKTFSKPNWAFAFITFILTVTLNVLTIRGGVQEMPIQQSDVYFSENNHMNLLATNTTWNFMHSVLKNGKTLTENPYKYFEKKESADIVRGLYHNQNKANLSILKTQRPNIVLIIGESMGADIIGAMGGFKDITPNLDSIISQGLLFEHIYASAERSQDGIASIFSAFPAQQYTSLGKMPAKSRKLPSMLNILKNEEYSTSFHFGGQLNFGNIKAFLYGQGMQDIFDIDDFSDREITSRLGAHDEHLFNKLLTYQKELKSPYFSVAFTQSTHSPYDQPVQDQITWGGIHKGYLNGAWYTDSCINNYVAKARNVLPDYENTLFIMIADHTHTNPRTYTHDLPDRRKIPLVIWGPALKNEFKGKRIKKIGNQTDFPATILAQMNLENKTNFYWSKDLLDSNSVDFAYYCSGDILGWKDNNGYLIYNNEIDSIMSSDIGFENIKRKNLDKAKAYTQKVFDQYLEY